MANPPFNVDGVDKDKLAGDPRFPFGIPKPDNGNYLWIQLFYSALSDRGRAGFVMANSAGDAGHSEREIRRQLIESGAVDVMVAIGTNFFYTVTLPVTLWFLDKAKRGTEREDTVLFLDARHLYRQIDRAHRDFLPEQIEFLANIVRLYRGEDVETVDGSDSAAQGAVPGRRVRRRARACARSRLAPRSRPRAGASTRAATPALPPSRTTARTSSRSSPAVRGVLPPQRRGGCAASQGRHCRPRDPRRMSEWRDYDTRRTDRASSTAARSRASTSQQKATDSSLTPGNFPIGGGLQDPTG